MKKIAVVTGAGSGIGRRTVEWLISQGWLVWGLDISAEALERHAAALKADYHYQPCDVSDPGSVQAVFSTLRQHVDHIDALICSAGVVRVGSLEENTPEQVD